MLTYGQHNLSLCGGQRPPNRAFGPVWVPSAQPGFGAFGPVLGLSATPGGGHTDTQTDTHSVSVY